MIAIWVTMFIEAVQRPDLVLKLWQEGNAQMMSYGKTPFQVVNVQVVNRPLPGGLGWLQRNAATEASGMITFRRENGEPALRIQVFVSPEQGAITRIGRMPVRWANSRQPGYEIAVRRPGEKDSGKWQISDPERLSATQAIRPGNLEGSEGGINDGVLSIALRFRNESECYGVTNDSYYHSFRPPDWKLAESEYLVDVEVTASNARCEGVFRLDCGGGPSEPIRLAKATAQEESRVKKHREQERKAGM